VDQTDVTRIPAHDEHAAKLGILRIARINPTPQHIRVIVNAVECNSITLYTAPLERQKVQLEAMSIITRTSCRLHALIESLDGRCADPAMYPLVIHLDDKG
jgi:hypothetical protein